MMPACSTTLSQCFEDNPETIIALATLDFREGRFDKALETYKIAQQVMGDQPMLTYCVALCHYNLKDYDEALEHVEEIIDERRDEQMGSHCVDISFFVEALNLKAAVLFTAKKYEAAKNTMSYFNENLDTVTIHNDVIVHIEEDPSIGMQKLEFILQQQPFPPETLSNLLTLYIKHGQDDLSAETFETNKHLAQELLPPDVYAYFDAIMMSLSCPEDAQTMLDTQIAKLIPKLRSGKQDISKAMNSATNRPATSRPATSSRPTTAAERKGQRALTVANKEFEATLDRFIPALCLQARLLWDRKEYSRAEELLRKSADFCHDSDAWCMNMGHVMFAQQDDKFEESIEHYELLLKSYAEADLLKVPAVALANMCVAYVMTNQNEAAESMIKTVEREEQRKGNFANKDERTYHSCIINLVIGTLYCERGNFEFGISRICKCMAPFEKNLCQDTWFYTKRCFLALASKISKMMYLINDDTLQDILCFFSDVESNGIDIITEKEASHSDPLQPEPMTIASEARQLRSIFITLCA